MYKYDNKEISSIVLLLLLAAGGVRGIEWTTGKKKAKKEVDWKVAKKDVKTWKEKLKDRIV